MGRFGTKSEDVRTLYCDPGEDFGWAIGRGTQLLAGGTEKMWPMIDEIEAMLANPDDPDASLLNGDDYARVGMEGKNVGPVGRIVCEDFRIYPWKAKDLAWDRVRTARAIGAITDKCRRFDLPLILQAAAIKPAAESAGAHELYYKPLRENRHQNDAIQHFVFFMMTELLGMKLNIPEDWVEENPYH